MSKKRGAELERRLDCWIDNLNALGVCAYRLEVRYNLSAKVYSKKQAADFLCWDGTTLYLLDVKECEKAHFYPSKQPKHQIEAIKKVQSMGGVAGFVVWFRRADPAGVNLRLIIDTKTPATYYSGTRFDWMEIISKQQAGK